MYSTPSELLAGMVYPDVPGVARTCCSPTRGTASRTAESCYALAGFRTSYPKSETRSNVGNLDPAGSRALTVRRTAGAIS